MSAYGWADSGGGDRGRYDMRNFVRTGAVDVVALCDIWGEQIDQAKKGAPDARAFRDHRALLDSKDIDVVLIGTPDHWHVPVAIHDSTRARTCSSKSR